MMMSGNNGGGGPCGACKFLRRKCVKGCVFAPYFDADQGTDHFAAVHKVFGASNASKLLTRIPPHKRLDAVVTLCYEAISRARDPVYGCVAHIVALQQQVVNLQAELAYTHSHLSRLQQSLPMASASEAHNSTASPPISLHSMNMASSYNVSIMQFDDPLQPHQHTSYFNPFDQELDGGDLQALAREFVAKYLPGVKLNP